MLHGLCLFVALFPAAPADGLLPYDSRWQYPHYLSWRPGDGAADVDPPRFSWPYVPDVIGDNSPPPTTFRLQIAVDDSFAKPTVDVTSPYNFYNALKPLGPGHWFWRVQYQPRGGDAAWGEVRQFVVQPGTPTWDRSPILDAGQRLAARPHPRLAPERGDWAAWKSKLEADPRGAEWLVQTLDRAAKLPHQAWWKEFPTTDRKDESALNDQQFAKVANDLATAALAYRLTGDQTYLRAGELATALASFPKGGLSSPEYHGAPRKWPSQIAAALALVHDWLYNELTTEQRAAILGSVAWRLDATYLDKASWGHDGGVAPQGAAMFCQSHPYENFMWNLPAVLLCAGDLPVADELVPLVLNYLTGVTSAHGPEEGWNEGLSYGNWKGNTMLEATMAAQLLLPDLQLGRNPMLTRLGRWYAHLHPLGVTRLAFGDYARDPEGKRVVERDNQRYLAWLNGDGRCRTRAEALAGEVKDAVSGRPWLELFAVTQMTLPEPAPEVGNALFAEAGWVMVDTAPPSGRAAFADSVGMIFKARPRGGFSHSYRAEGDFVWHAYGQTLSAGGGNTAYPDPHARNSLSHNVILIDGVGQEWNPKAPTAPLCARLVSYREGDGYTAWAADLTHAYQTVEGLQRWIRHVVFVDGTWFAVYDDLAMDQPAKFSWLYHVAPPVDLTVEGQIAYRMEDVEARVQFAEPGKLEFRDLRRKDGYKNLITGADMYQETADRLAGKGRELLDDSLMEHNVWVTNAEPAKEWSFLAVLTAGRGEAVAASFADGRQVTVKGKTVSFDAATPGDVTIDAAAVRAHAAATDPVR